MAENVVQTNIMLDIGRGLSRIWRNNVGVAFNKSGTVVRYGVGGTGGSDLLGFVSVVVTPEMVGRNVAIFTAIECKDKGRATPDQLKFIEIVREAGGRAGVARSVEEARAIVAGTVI